MVWMCSSATNRLITSKDHASVQINVGHLDEYGVYTGHFSTFAFCGFVRAQVDSEIHHLHAELLVSATWFLHPV